MARVGEELPKQNPEELLIKSGRSGQQQQQHQQQDSHTTTIDRLPTIFIPRQTACDTLQSIIQVHFDKTLDKKRAIDSQKKELWRLFSLFFVFLAILFSSVIQSSDARLRCRHSWAPIALCFLAHIMFYVSLSQTLKCINSFKYQRRCHKLTLSVATEKLKRIKASGAVDLIREEDMEVRYQEPDDEYIAKFKRKWLMFTLFLGLDFSVLVSAFAQILCSS